MENPRESIPRLPPQPQGKVLQPWIRIVAEQFDSEPYGGPEEFSIKSLFARIGKMQPIRFEFVMDDTLIRESFERMTKAMRKEIDKNFDEQMRQYFGHWSAPDFTIHELDHTPVTNRQYGPPVHDKKKNFRRQHRR